MSFFETPEGRYQLSDIVSGFGQMMWRIVGYDGAKEILQQEVPLNQADEAGISEILRSLAALPLRKSRQVWPTCGTTPRTATASY